MLHDSDEQKEVNEALIGLAKKGSSFALNQLWEINRGFIHSKVWELYGSSVDYLNSHGFTIEDMCNEMFFALSKAVEGYEPSRGGFLTYLSSCMRSRATNALLGEHCRTVTDKEDGRKRKLSGNPINNAEELDAPVPGYEDVSRLDLVMDPSGENDFRKIEDAAAENYLSETVRAAVGDLPDKQRTVVTLHRLSDSQKSFAEIAAEMRVSGQRASQLEREALKALAKDPRIKMLHDEFIGGRAYQHTSFSAWKNSGASSEEYLIEMLESKGLIM